MNFSDLYGQRLGFCGVDNNTFCVVTEAGERVAFEVVEDECDGYRSALEEVRSIPLDGRIFFPTPIATLAAREAARDAGYFGEFLGDELVDDGGHVWLRFGTDNSDDYYPNFTFMYDPRRDSQSNSEGSR